MGYSLPETPQGRVYFIAGFSARQIWNSDLHTLVLLFEVVHLTPSSISIMTVAIIVAKLSPWLPVFFAIQPRLVASLTMYDCCMVAL